jgi:hypothetical protein
MMIMLHNCIPCPVFFFFLFSLPALLVFFDVPSYNEIGSYPKRRLAMCLYGFGFARSHLDTDSLYVLTSIFSCQKFCQCQLWLM